MSATGHSPTPEGAVYQSASDNPFEKGKFGEDVPASPGDAARLRTIHEKVRSGDYHVPASAIADRMIERMVSVRRVRAS